MDMLQKPVLRPLSINGSWTETRVVPQSGDLRERSSTFAQILICDNDLPYQP